MIILPWQPSGKACCGECSLSGHRCGEAEARPRRMEVEAVLAAGPSWLAQGLGNRICKLHLRSYSQGARVTSVIFTCCDVRKEESNRNSGLKLVGSRPFEMLAGATALNVSPLCFRHNICSEISATVAPGGLFNTYSLTLCSQPISVLLFLFLLCSQHC